MAIVLSLTITSCAPKADEIKRPLIGFSFTGKVVEKTQEGTLVTNAEYTYRVGADPTSNRTRVDSPDAIFKKNMTTADPTTIFTVYPIDVNKAPVIFDYHGGLTSDYTYLFNLPASSLPPSLTIKLFTKEDRDKPINRFVEIYEKSITKPIFESKVLVSECISIPISKSKTYTIKIFPKNWLGKIDRSNPDTRDINTPNLPSGFSYETLYFF